MVKIRLRRMGSSRQAFYRIVAADNRKARDGRFLDVIGFYDPLKKPVELKIDEGKFFDWMGNGAQVTDTVRSLLRKTGTWEKWSRKKQGGEDIEAEVIFIRGEKRTSPDPE